MPASRASTPGSPKPARASTSGSPKPARASTSSAPKPARATVRPPDGRHARTTRTRAAIVDALLALVASGQPAPTAAEIAAKAKISLRSIAVHFPARDLLFAAAANRYHERPPLPEPSPDLPVERRLAELLRIRAVELEASRPIRASAARLAAESTIAANALATSAARRREVVARVFAPEIARGGPDLLEILDLLLGGRVWDALRERRLPAADICRLLGEQLRRALTALT
jgi:TetR/AcrR family transcriptional regulator, regulator of autoinduction and epiphytic fitness